MNQNIALWTECPLETDGRNAGCPSLTPYFLEGEGPFPVFIVMPGGGYESRSPHEGISIAKWLNEMGISAFVLNYRVAPFRYPHQLEEAQRAIRLVRSRAKDWRLDPSRLGIIGFSAGGHLASTVGTHYDSGSPQSSDPVERQSCRPDLMVLGYPVISLGALTHKGSLSALLGDRQNDEKLVEQLSSETQVTVDTPPTFMWHTMDDPVALVDHSILFAQALRKQGVAHALHLFGSGPHGMGLALGHREGEPWPSLCEAWLKSMSFIRVEPHFSGYSTIEELFNHEAACDIVRRYLPTLETHPFFHYLKFSPLLTIVSFDDFKLQKDRLNLLIEDLASLR